MGWCGLWMFCVCSLLLRLVGESPIMGGVVGLYKWLVLIYIVLISLTTALKHGDE